MAKLTSQVVSVQGALDAYQDAWFYARVFFYEIGLSVSSGQNRNGIHTGWWRNDPGNKPNNPQDPIAGARWDAFQDKCGTFLQDFVSGTGARSLWFDYTSPSGLYEGVRGPYGTPDMRYFFKRALLERVLSQTKARSKVIATAANGETNSLLLRVPHS